MADPYGAGTTASPRVQSPQGQIDGCIGQLEIEANRHENLISRLATIIERLRGQTPNPPSPLNEKGRIELVKPLTQRIAITCDRFGGGNTRLDSLISELDGLI